MLKERDGKFKLAIPSHSPPFPPLPPTNKLPPKKKKKPRLLECILHHLIGWVEFLFLHFSSPFLT
jgi:hypothetical protein